MITYCNKCGAMMSLDEDCKYCVTQEKSNDFDSKSFFDTERLVIISVAALGVIIIIILFVKFSSSKPPLVLSAAALRIEYKLQQGIDISNENLDGLSEQELHVLRYVPDARYGSTFDNDPDLKAFFSSRPWYRPNPNFDGSMLSQTDVYNENWVRFAEDKAASKSNKNTSGSSPLEAEAIKHVQHSLEQQVFSKCSDGTYFLVIEGILDESGGYWYRDPSFVVIQTNPLSEADRLNGVVWSGKVEFRYSAMRYSIVNSGTVSPWQNYQQRNSLTFNVVKSGNTWHISSDNPARFAFYTKRPCPGG